MSLARLKQILSWRGGALAEEPADLAQVLHNELDQILWRRRVIDGLPPEAKPQEPKPQENAAESIQQYYQLAHANNLSALCLSGGGIRSAAFSLGILQGLATRRVLPKFDFLSTVSGGGYIGSFLTAWVNQAGYYAVIRQMATTAAPNTDSPLSYLRRYSQYLTPRSGLLSADTLAVAALFIRNLFLNWLVILPFILVAVFSVKIIAGLVWLTSGLAKYPYELLFAAIAIILIGASLVDSLRQRPGWESEKSERLEFSKQELAPMMFGVFFAMVAVWLHIAESPATMPLFNNMLRVMGTGATMSLIAWLIAYYFSQTIPKNISKPRDTLQISTRFPMRNEGAKWLLLAALGFSVFGGVSGLLAAALYGAISYLPPTLQYLAIPILGPPAVIVAFFLGELIYIGLTSYTPWSDAEREWLARAAGYHGLVSFGYLITSGLVLAGSAVIFNYAGKLPNLPWALTVSGGLSGLAVAILGKAPATFAFVREANKTWKSASYNSILAVATPIFFATLIILISYGLDRIFFQRAFDEAFQNRANLTSVAIVPTLVANLPTSLVAKLPACLVAKLQTFFDDGFVARFSLMIVVAFGLAILGLFSALVINTNRFSLHGMYRNRLIRAFLGASNAKRSANKFTDFDEHDNVRMCELWPGKEEEDLIGPKWGPAPQLLVVNMALNALSSRELQLQERKALPFFATPRWVGTGQRTWKGGNDLERKGCFRPAELYGDKISLGTAITISGAAASPNMGYHSSPSLGLLLTLFNVRLGAWLGNPGPEGKTTFSQQGPRVATRPLFKEALGLTTAEDRYVYLSDGGHFENLGAYEMLRRRCHFIMVCDAGCDPKYGYEDLGNLVRRAGIDFGIQIEFRPFKTPQPPRNSPLKGEYFALGDIYYPEGMQGLLLYIKPGLYGSEPASVRAYHSLHPEFPHEPTMNQWFGETQFEAYRALGAHVIQTLVPSGVIGDVQTLFTQVESRL